ncbi:RICIN domain-containing protein [Nonomuraea insulae]|uniref:RICIN domain-containing protein n=1 Tax=Nonomuraea insulae TaxID=1616787 RepID=A0ABW1CC54_9ACTN
MQARRALRKIVIGTLMMALITMGAVTAGTGPASAAPLNTSIQLRNLAYNQCMDLAGGASHNGAWIGRVPCANEAKQKWILEDRGMKTVCVAPGPVATNTCATQRIQEVRIKSAATGKCVDIYEGGTASGTHIWQWDCSENQTQRWVAAEEPGGAITFVSSHVYNETNADHFRAIDANPDYQLRIWTTSSYVQGLNTQRWAVNSG